MALQLQFELFESIEQTEIKSLSREVEKLKISLDKQRKKQFSLLGEQTKIINDLKSRLEILERGFCQNATNFTIQQTTANPSSPELSFF